MHLRQEIQIGYMYYILLIYYRRILVDCTEIRQIFPIHSFVLRVIDRQPPAPLFHIESYLALLKTLRPDMISLNPFNNYSNNHQIYAKTIVINKGCGTKY